VTSAPRRPPLALRDVADAATAVRQAGGRLTAARRAVLEALFAADGPVSADAIAGGLGGRVARSDPASAYRNLEWLEALGVVRHVHLGHGPGLYALAARGASEYLVCEGCGEVSAVDASRLDRARDEIRRATGHEAHFDHFPLHGLCGRCAQRTPTRSTTNTSVSSGPMTPPAPRLP
jgi:Fur family ferric uptake transcriptional regulator